MISEIFWQLISNFCLLAPLASIAVSQILKIFIYYFKDGEFDLSHLLEASGMPSSHASAVCALTLAVGLQNGLNSIPFAMAAIFSGIVMYDAAGVRQAAGKQARILNRMIEEGDIEAAKMNELLGHTPLEVIGGAIVGLLTTLLLFFVLIIPTWPAL